MEITLLTVKEQALEIKSLNPDRKLTHIQHELAKNMDIKLHKHF